MQRTSPIHKGRGLSPPGVAAHLAEPTIALPAGLGAAAQSSRDRAGPGAPGWDPARGAGQGDLEGRWVPGGARQTGEPAGGSGRGRGDPQPICRLPEPASAARLSRAPAAGPAGRGQMSDTFKGWKQSIFQSDHLKHLGNYTLKISVINSPESAAIAAPGCPALADGPAAGPACRHWNRAPGGPRAPGTRGSLPWEVENLFAFPLPSAAAVPPEQTSGRGRRGRRRRDPFVCKEVLFPHLKKGGVGAAAAPRAPPAPPARPGRPRDTD